MSANTIIDTMLKPIEIASILLMDTDGNRVVAKYYDNKFPDSALQKVFEKDLHRKLNSIKLSPDVDVIIFQDYLVLYQKLDEMYLIVLMSIEENEIVGHSVFTALSSCLTTLFTPLTRIALEKNLDQVLLIIDETCDDGMILENNPANILDRVLMKGNGPNPSTQDHSLSSALTVVGEQLLRSLRS